jgi:hypothetical protein
MPHTREPAGTAAGRVPVVAVTGHLGAGKTSLVNHLLRTPGARLGVVVNDFGALNVDAALVTGQVDEAAAISGGCVCCLPDAGGLDDALGRLAHPRLRLDAIVVEASGVARARRARPADPLQRRRPRTPGRRGGRDRRPEPLHDDRLRRRCACALRDRVARRDRQTDLLPASERASTIARIAGRVRSRNPRAHLATARAGAIDPALVFDVADQNDPIDELPLARITREAHHGPGHHAHEHARSASVPLRAPVSPSALVDLLEHPPRGVSPQGAGACAGHRPRSRLSRRRRRLVDPRVRTAVTARDR